MDNPEPQRAVFQEDDELGNLAHNVSEALRALPIYFRTATRIEGLDVGDLFSLSGVLGSSIESQVVETLNGIREVWDPDDRWPRHRFVRFAQTFPDVRLMTTADEGRDAVALGLELKGWYLLAKEREPSFRYQVTPAACSPYDLLVVVPWHLKNVLSGEPLVYAPYIEQARYVAEYRNWWWTNVRKTNDAKNQRRIHPPGGSVRPYPPAKSNIADRPAKDGGSNFGRIARLTGLMDDYTGGMREQQIAGIAADHWTLFFRRHAEAKDREKILEHLAEELEREGVDRKAASDVAEAVKRIVKQFE